MYSIKEPASLIGAPIQTDEHLFEAVLMLDEHVDYLLRLANQRYVTIFQINAPFGLTPTQFATVVRLSQ
jgi:hypothetical protein